MQVITENRVVPNLRFGEFENDWNNHLLDDIATFLKGKGISKSEIDDDGMTECIRYGELYVYYNELINEVKSKTNLKNIVLSKANDVIIPASGETQLDIATASCVLRSGIALGGDLNIIRTDNNGVFLSYYLNSKKKFEIARLSQGSSVVHLYASQLKTLKLNLPSLPEQQKIASFLSVVDEKIQQLTKKKDLLETYKKGVMQKIFSKELRFKDEFGNNYPDWEEKKLGEELEHKSIRNKSNQVDLVLSVSNKKGFISQQEQFDGHQVASKDVTNYKVVNKGEYAYNPSRINVGSIARLDDFEKGIVSPMYVIFRLKNNLNPIFFDALYNSHRFKYLIKIGCSGSVRDSLNFDEMEKFDIKLPCIEEQQKIANFLSSIDKKIDLVNTQIENTKAFKKGLLQQMFV
ncbi:MAG: restriction endonuclease subunit S [Nonlabens sp.]|uniref:restriction endonuclease subunit S n=1 Tax=Nonlabens sp. TaxID=1888209 RepID=UPI00321ADD49